ncbi:MAG: hydrogen gas-evolving membrane-bound hydrogenase subunit E, partial [Pseudomonadota bacterium]
PPFFFSPSTTDTNPTDYTLSLDDALAIFGTLLYAFHVRIRAALIAGHFKSLDERWDGWLDAFKAFAAWQTRLIQSGRLTAYLRYTFVTLLVGLGGTMLWTGATDVVITIPDVTFKSWSVVALILGGTLVTIVTTSRIAAMAGLGVVGIGVALIFIVFGAPDVAITQLLVETLVVVLFAVAALRLPQLGKLPARPTRLLNAAIAGALGVIVTMILLMVTNGPIDRRLTDFFEAASWPEAFGRNIVNVILVDFRALDTFGEIAVVIVAALGAYALLKGSKEGERS